MTSVITEDVFRHQLAPLCKQRGFQLAGMVAVPDSPGNLDALAPFPKWIAQGRHGDMAYLARHAENGELLRARISTALPWARSVLMLACNYRTDSPGSLDPHPEGSGWIARYAFTGMTAANTDYHDVLLERLRALEVDLREVLAPQSGSVPAGEGDNGGALHMRSFVDTGPFIERALASHAGLGWQAKNTCLIHPELGSWFFLASIAMSLPYEAAPHEAREFAATGHLPGRVGADTVFGDASRKPLTHESRSPSRAYLPEGQCGTCTRCIEACPTGALDQPYWMDATRCIAYLTIEKRGPVPDDLKQGIGRQIFGCDICQDVCPWNERAARRGNFTHDPAMQSRAALINPSLLELGRMSDDELQAVIRRSPMRRTKRAGMRRNIAIAMGNAPRAGYIPLLREWYMQDEDPALSEAAGWALRQLEADAGRHPGAGEAPAAEL